MSTLGRTIGIGIVSLTALVMVAVVSLAHGETSTVRDGLSTAQAGARLELTAVSTDRTAQKAMSNESSCGRRAAAPTRLFLQQIRAESVIVRWRGPARFVCVWDVEDDFVGTFDAQADGDHWRAFVTGLQPDQRYRYGVGGTSADTTFRTAPVRGRVPADGAVQMLLLGDSGTAGEVGSDGRLEHEGEALAVLEGFRQYRRDRPAQDLDLLLLLDDNAYPAGTDHEWQVSFFDIYPDILASVTVVPTIGNHEMGFGLFDMCTYQRVDACDEGPVVVPIGGASRSSDPLSYDSDGDGPDGTGLPYLDMFELPTNGDVGGVASGTELYYSLDYGNVHVVSLDSQLSNQDDAKRAAMRQWLIDDLSANEQDWTVVIFHHPPYSKGENHDSDLEETEIDIRETFVEVFDRYGVDAVYSGHAHSYERSWYIGGHTGSSDTFDAALHAELDDVGQPTFGMANDPYPKRSRVTMRDDKVVYTVAGNAGHTNYEHPCRGTQTIGCTKDDWLEHPAHRTFDSLDATTRSNGIANIGSVVVTATEDRLVSEFVDQHGEVLDYFMILAPAG